jgi:hypothetical protein
MTRHVKRCCSEVLLAALHCMPPGSGSRGITPHTTTSIAAPCPGPLGVEAAKGMVGSLGNGHAAAGREGCTNNFVLCQKSRMRHARIQDTHLNSCCGVVVRLLW